MFIMTKQSSEAIAEPASQFSCFGLPPWIVGVLIPMIFCLVASGRDRLVVHTEINKQCAVFVVDTGSHVSLIVSKQAASRLGLYVKEEGNPRANDYSMPDYNRLGVSFCPKSMDSEVLEAYVLPNSPGYRQGIRNGDILLSVDDTDMTKWKTDPEISKKKFWFAEAGVKYSVMVKRGEKEVNLQVTLEEIFSVNDRTKHKRLNSDGLAPAD